MKPKTVLCPKCPPDQPLRIVETELERHFEAFHNKYFEEPPEYDYDDLDPDEIDFLQKNMDATKDYGYPCREGGRYGSYSGHDGFDDESDSE